MQMKPYVNFPGSCAEALRYYQQHLGGTITQMMNHGQMPGPSSAGPDWKDKVLHARITIAGSELLAADIPNAEPMRSAYLTLFYDDDAAAEQAFAALADGGQVFMPMAETFFASRFAQLRDRFGINWTILHERPPQG